MEQDRSRLLGGGGHRRGPLYGEKTCRPQHGRQTTVTPSEGAQAVKAAGDGSLARRQDATRGRWRTGGSGRKHSLEPAPCQQGESQPGWKAGGRRGATTISLANSLLLHHLRDPDPLGDVTKGTGFFRPPRSC